MKSSRHVAMDLLSRREHTQAELRQKLQRKAFSSEEIDQTLSDLTAEGLQSDAVFAERYLQLRHQKGYGPLRIRQELKQKGVSAEAIEAAFDAAEIDWRDSLQQLYDSRFVVSDAIDYPQKMKQARFLQNRGFSPESVMRLFR